MMIIHSSTLWIWTRMSHKPCAEMRPTWDMACVWVTSKSVLFLFFFCFLLITFTYSGNNTALSKITIPKEHSKAETACGKVPYTNHKDKVITLNIHFVLKMGKASSVFMFQPFKILFADKIYLGFFFFSLFLCYC